MRRSKLNPNLHRCGFCNGRFEEACELREHVKDLCLRSGSKAWAGTKRNIVNSGSGKDLQKARLLGGDESDGVKIGGQEHEYCLDGEILGSILSGDNDCLPAINQRMAIGRDAFNALYRVFKRKTLTVALKVRFYESFVIGTLHGSHGWIFGGAVIRRLNGWSARMLSTITGRSIRSDGCCSSSGSSVPSRYCQQSIRGVDGLAL